MPKDKKAPSELVKLKQDWRVNSGYTKSRLILTIFRVGRQIRSVPIVGKPASVPVRALYRLLVEWIFAVEIPWAVDIGGGLKLEHPTGIVVHPRVQIGSNVTIKQNVTIGIRGSKTDRHGVPVIGDFCVIGSAAQVLGGISLGNGSQVGAGAVVLQDVGPNCTAVGNPARIVDAK